MSILKWFNKPKWQNPNIQVRIAAIQNSQDPELLRALPEIVNNDPSEQVQKTALSQIENPDQLLEVSQNHTNKTIRQQANKKLINWFKTEDLVTQLPIFKRINVTIPSKTVAQSAQSTQVRSYALQQIKQPGLLSDLLLTEKDPNLQKVIVDKIDQPATLNRLLNKTSKKNTALRKLINDKINQNQPADQSEAGIKLCLALEGVVHGKNQTADLAAITKNWQAIEKDVPETLKMRYNGAFAAAKMILDPEHRSQFLQKQKQQRATALLTELETLLTKTNNSSLKQIQNHLNKYQAVNLDDFNAEQQERFQKAINELVTNRDAIQKEQQIPETATETLDAINKLLTKPTVQPDQLKRFKQQWSKATKNIKTSEALSLINDEFNEAALKLAEKIEQSAQLRDQAANEAVELIEPTIIQIKEGHLLKAKKMTNQIAEKKQIAGYNHPIIKQHKYQLDSVWQQLKDLRNWQKWSNDKARQDIIEELHEMIGKGQHPDAVLKKLKDSNERWYALEEMEKLPGDKFSSRNQKMWQDFRIVSKALFDPTQPFFEKRSEQQDSHLETIKAHIQLMQSTDLEETSERNLARLTRDAIKHLKSLDKLPPKQRGVTAKKLRSAIDPIDKKLNAGYKLAEEKKLKLVEQAQQLADVEDNFEAIESAKKLQQQWKSAGIVKQNIERKLWKKFRKANDAVFNRRDAEKQQHNEAQEAKRKQAQDLLAELNKQLKNTQQVNDLHALKSTAKQQWHELEDTPKFLTIEFEHLLQNIDAAVKTIAFKSELRQYQDKQKLDDIYSQFEQGQIDADEKLKKSEKLSTDALNEFFSTRENQQATNDDLAAQLIEAEFLTGLETPEAFIENRMAYQVKVLSMRMSGEKAPSNQAQASAWLNQWFLTPKLDAAFVKSNKKRINQAIKALQELMME